MINSWVSSQYLGHKNLKDALDMLKRAKSNVAITLPTLIVYPDTQSGTPGLGGFLRVTSTFAYRIEDTTYTKGLGITSAVNTGDATCSLIPHHATNNTATGGFDIVATYYRAGVLLIDADGTFTSKACATVSGLTKGVSAGARAQAIAYLVNTLDNDDLADKAVVAIWVIGDGTNAFLSTSSLTIATNVDLYQCGGMALSTGQSTDGQQIMSIL